MSETLSQSDPRATYRRVYFTCVDTAALQTYLQSSDMSTFTVKISKNGGSAAAVAAAAPTQVDATNAKGLFYVELAIADISTAGKAVLLITNTGGTKTMEPRFIELTIQQAFFATATTGTLTATSFLTDRAETTVDFWKDALALFLTGALTGQVKKIGGYSGSKVITLATGLTYTSAPANGDVCQIINR